MAKIWLFLSDFEIEERSVPFEFKAAAVHFEEDVLYYGKGGLYTSCDKKKLPEMLVYYEKKGCSVATLGELVNVWILFEKVFNENKRLVIVSDRAFSACHSFLSKEKNICGNFNTDKS